MYGVVLFNSAWITRYMHLKKITLQNWPISNTSVRYGPSVSLGTNFPCNLTPSYSKDASINPWKKWFDLMYVVLNFDKNSGYVNPDSWVSKFVQDRINLSFSWSWSTLPVLSVQRCSGCRRSRLLEVLSPMYSLNVRPFMPDPCCLVRYTIALSQGILLSIHFTPICSLCRNDCFSLNSQTSLLKIC